MEYFQLNLYQQGRQKVQKGVFGLKPEVVATAPAAVMGLLLLFFIFVVYVPRRSTLDARRTDTVMVQQQIETMIRASQIIKPAEKQFLQLRQERVRLTSYLQDIVETIPRRVWIVGLEWRAAPVSGRQPQTPDAFSFRKNELTIKGRAFPFPGQSPFGLTNEFINALAASDRLGANYTVELGRTTESKEQKPRSITMSATNPVPTAAPPESRTVLDFTVHCRVKEK